MTNSSAMMPPMAIAEGLNCGPQPTPGAPHVRGADDDADQDEGGVERRRRARTAGDEVDDDLADRRGREHLPHAAGRLFPAGADQRFDEQRDRHVDRVGRERAEVPPDARRPAHGHEECALLRDQPRTVQAAPAAEPQEHAIAARAPQRPRHHRREADRQHRAPDRAADQFGNGHAPEYIRRAEMGRLRVTAACLDIRAERRRRGQGAE